MTLIIGGLSEGQQLAPAAFWTSPCIYEDGNTIAEAEKLVRKATKTVWLKVRGGPTLHLSKKCVLDSLRSRGGDGVLPARLYVVDGDSVAGGLAGTVWLGE
jgi:hypothetical protein